MPSISNRLPVFIILALAILSFTMLVNSVPACALPVDYHYTITASDDIPSTSWVDVRAGNEITVSGDASITYTGAIPIYVPGFTAVTDLALTRNGNTVASKHGEESIDGMMLSKGDTVTRHVDCKLLVPAGTPPGQYVLKASAYADLPFVGRKSDSQTFNVRVYDDAQPSPSVSPSPVPSVSPSPAPSPKVSASPSPSALPSASHNPSPGAASPSPAAGSTGKKLEVVPVNANVQVDTAAFVGTGMAGSRDNIALPGTNCTIIGSLSNKNGRIVLENATVDTGFIVSGNLSGRLTIHLTNLSGNPGLNMTITDKVPDAVRSGFELAALQDNVSLGNVAYALVVEKTGMANGNDVANGIADAVVTMKVPESWVLANGGKDQVRIIHYNDDTKAAEVLETRWAGNEAGPNNETIMVFEAVSPHGLSVFALASVYALSSIPASATGGTAPFGLAGTILTSPPQYLILALVLMAQIAVGIVLGYYKLKK